jgi:hypothetical protein
MRGPLDEAARALEAWSLTGARLEPLGHGLINRTFLVSPTPHQMSRLGGASRGVLQRLNPIFDPGIHENIAAVTTRLRERGLATLELVPTDDGAWWTDRAGVYRMYAHVDGESFDVLTSLAQARSGGHIVGAFHAALEGLEHRFVGMRLGVHDTARHLDVLRRAVESHGTHVLHADVARLADAILAQAEALPALPSLELRIGHGDLKLGNLLFVRGEPERAHCLVDLDTVGPIHLGHELGDLWRSWCNRSTEDEDIARLDLEVMRTSWLGYLDGLGRPATADERTAASLGLDWIALELTARFAADALNESYFGWDASRFPSRGAHNLKRARGQWALFEAVRHSRIERATILDCT